MPTAGLKLALLASVGVLASFTGCADPKESRDAGRQPSTARAQSTGAAQPDSVRRALILYGHVFNGVVPGWETPGLRNCSMRASLAEYQHIFQALPEAAWSEGVEQTPEEQARAEKARRFAAQHNRETLRTREAEVRRICPDVQLDPAS